MLVAYRQGNTPWPPARSASPPSLQRSAACAWRRRARVASQSERERERRRESGGRGGGAEAEKGCGWLSCVLADAAPVML